MVSQFLLSVLFHRTVENLKLYMEAQADGFTVLGVVVSFYRIVKLATLGLAMLRGLWSRSEWQSAFEFEATFLLQSLVSADLHLMILVMWCDISNTY